MTAATQARAVLAVLGTMILAILVAGCSPLTPILTIINEAASGSSVKPVVGDCWRASYAEVTTASTWSGGRTVDCSKPHESYTFEVANLPKRFTGSWQDSSTGTMRTDISEAAWSVCDPAISDFLPTLDVTANRFEFSFFLPSLKSWADGARWVRCDASLIAIGSKLSSPRLAALPNSGLVDQLNRAPESLKLGINTPDATPQTDPFNSPSATYADCAKSPQWREESQSDLPGDDSAPFPDDAALGAFEQQHCADRAEAANQSWVTYEPTEDTWKHGDRVVECWVSGGGGGSSS